MAAPDTTPEAYLPGGFESDLAKLFGPVPRRSRRVQVAEFSEQPPSPGDKAVRAAFRAFPVPSRVRFLFALHLEILWDQVLHAAAPADALVGYDREAPVPRLVNSSFVQRPDAHPFELLLAAEPWARGDAARSTNELEVAISHFTAQWMRFLTVRLPGLLPSVSKLETRRVAETILAGLERYPRPTEPKEPARWASVVWAHLDRFRLPSVPSLGELPYVENRHAFVPVLEDFLHQDRSLRNDGIETLAEALRDLVRGVEGDVDPREAVAWINRALEQPIVVSKERLHEAIRWGRDRRWLGWSGGMIRRAGFADRTALAAVTRNERAWNSDSGEELAVEPAPRSSRAPTTAPVPGRQVDLFATRTAAPASSPVVTRAAPPTAELPESTRNRATRTVHDEPIVAGTSAPELLAGMVIQGERRWRLLRQAGQGGMGRVWEARAVDPPETHVAVKTVAAPTPANRAGLERELSLLRTLHRADYFPVIHDTFDASGHLHLVMDWVPGRTLDAWVLDAGAPKVDVDRFFLWMEQVADRLSLLHGWPGRPILFRDLKPSNVLYDEESSRLRLVDFGIGHLAHPDGRESVRAGTAGFMAPEVRDGVIGVRTDIFSYGRLGLFLLYGSYNFGVLTPDTRPLDMAARRLTLGLVRALHVLCHPDPMKRPATVLAALRLLRASAAERPQVESVADQCPVCGRGRLPAQRFCPGCGELRRSPDPGASPPEVAFEHIAPPHRAPGALPGRVARAYEEFLAIRATADLHTLRCLTSIDVEPYDYQRTAALQVIGQMGGRAMIADDVGLGKTIEAGLIMKEYMHRGLVRRALLVAPPGLLLAQLCDELRGKFRIDIREYRSNGDNLDERYFVGPGGLGAADHVAVSLRTLTREATAASFASQSWDMVVVDECHHIKSSRAKGFRALRKIVAPYTLFMSATPFSGRPEELWTVYSALRPGALGDKTRFIEDFQYGKTEGHRQTIRGMTIRRRRAEILVRFPGREARRLDVYMNDAERRRYLAVCDAAKATARGSLAWIQPVLQVAASYEAVRSSEAFGRFPAALQRELERLTDADHPKVRAFLERFVDRLPPGEKALVFTHYQASQAAIVRLLRERGRNAKGLLGATAKMRQELLAWFREDPTAEFLVCGKGAGEGLNLQTCGLLVNLDLPWNPMQIEQRIGRIQRLGQPRRKVAIVNMALKDTIEDRVLEIMEKKLDMFTGTLGDTEQILGAMFEGEEETFENWVAATILPDGSLRPERKAEFEERLRHGRGGAVDERAGGFVDRLLGTGGDDLGGKQAQAPSKPPVSLDFLGVL